MSDTTSSRGNILGSSRAEADVNMLARAFVETADYQALAQTSDFNFVVGRRGTGKSALFAKLKEHFSNDNNTQMVSLSPAEHETMEMQRLLHQCGSNYRHLRALSRLVWKTHLLMTSAKVIQNHYRASKSSAHASVTEYLHRFADLSELEGVTQCNALLKFGMLHCGSDVSEIPAFLATTLRIEELKVAIDTELRQLRHSVVLMYDGLDEGWEPVTTSTAILGGLSLAAADLVDAHVPIRPLLFVRDNMFRALATEDNDFTRHVEGNTLRLHWDEASLFHLVAMRLRVALSLEDLEGDVKVWNRFAHRELKDKDGFRRCLQHTLYRPRDILVLLNDAFVNASREGRTEIIELDIEQSAHRISQHRVDDLLKEYDIVFPGLRTFVAAFRGGPAIRTFENATQALDEAGTAATDSNSAFRDFALFGSGRAVFFALYSVGFVGVLDPARNNYTFCHDGSASTLENVEAARLIAVHPCYWKALDLQAEVTQESVVIQINDDYDQGSWNDLTDVRTQRLGQIVEDLTRIEIGASGSADFERWVLQAVKILFWQFIGNVQLKPNPGATLQRDVVGTIKAERGFWRRIREDYGTRQMIFECKNYEELETDDFRQVLSYLSGEYGRFAIVVTRAAGENPSPAERAWVKTMHSDHQKLILILPAEILARCVRKLRNPNRRDYAEDALSKRMDTFVRSYLSNPSAKKFRKKKPRSQSTDSLKKQRNARPVS